MYDRIKVKQLHQKNQSSETMMVNGDAHLHEATRNFQSLLNFSCNFITACDWNITSDASDDISKEFDKLKLINLHVQCQLRFQSVKCYFIV